LLLRPRAHEICKETYETEADRGQAEKLARGRDAQPRPIARLRRAADAKADEAAAVKAFDLDSDQRTRLLVQERN
jgi:hypothetical protein